MLDGSGVRITSGEELAEIVRAGAEAGFPVAVHAIGDGANREALDAFERTRADLGAAGAAPPDRACAAARAGGPAALRGARRRRSVQFSHAPSDRDLADRFWGGKTDGAYAYRSLVDSGAVVANGSDAPIEELDPLAGIRAGVRRTIDERAAWHPERGGDGAAGVRGDDRRAGVALRRRAPARPAAAGLRRRLVVLDRDPWDDLDAEVVATMVAGRWVHNPPPWD